MSLTTGLLGNLTPWHKERTPPFRGILRLATTYTRTRKETPKDGALRRVLLCIFTEGRNFSMPQSTDASGHGRWLCQMRGRRNFRVGISWLVGCWSSSLTARRFFRTITFQAYPVQTLVKKGESCKNECIQSQGGFL